MRGSRGALRPAVRRHGGWDGRGVACTGRKEVTGSVVQVTGPRYRWGGLQAGEGRGGREEGMPLGECPHSTPPAGLPVLAGLSGPAGRDSNALLPPQKRPSPSSPLAVSPHAHCVDTAANSRDARRRARTQRAARTPGPRVSPLSRVGHHEVEHRLGGRALGSALMRPRLLVCSRQIL